MTPDQQTAADNALLGKLRDVYRDLTPSAIDRADLDGMAFTVDEAAERIKSLQAEVGALQENVSELEAERIEGLRATLRLQTQLANETLAARTREATLEADHQRLQAEVATVTSERDSAMALLEPAYERNRELLADRQRMREALEQIMLIKANDYIAGKTPFSLAQDIARDARGGS